MVCNCIELMTNICTNSINTIKITNFNNKAYILCRKGLFLLTLKKNLQSKRSKYIEMNYHFLVL